MRYSTSVLGYFWSILDPLVMAGIYWFVFTQVFDRGVGHEPYIVFLLSGLLPWMWFTGAISDATRAFLREAKLIRSTKIPRTIWVARLVLSKGIEFVASIPVLAIFAIATGATLHWEAVLLPARHRHPGRAHAGRRPDRRAARRVLPRPRAGDQARPALRCSTRRRSSTACTTCPRSLHLLGAFNPLSGHLLACTAPRSSPSSSTGSRSASAPRCQLVICSSSASSSSAAPSRAVLKEI